jgi:hypothetical protein
MSGAAVTRPLLERSARGELLQAAAGVATGRDPARDLAFALVRAEKLSVALIVATRPPRGALSGLASAASPSSKPEPHEPRDRPGLFVTERTVERRLTNVFCKPRIDSRNDLHALVGELSAPA